jgi:hypothetical protein
MLWKILKPAAFLALFVIVISLSVIGIRKSWVAAAKNDKFVCGTVTQLLGRVVINNRDGFVARVRNDGMRTLAEVTWDVSVPSLTAYNRLELEKEFTFIFREGELIAIADGNQCHK